MMQEIIRNANQPIDLDNYQSITAGLRPKLHARELPIHDGLNVEGRANKRPKYTTADREEPEWQAPSNQHGDGITDLNAKFGY